MKDLYPTIDKGFLPPYVVLTEFFKRASVPASVVLERNGGYNRRMDFNVTEKTGESYFVVERIVKTLLWAVGGYKVYFAGPKALYERLKEDYRKGGARQFDADFMAKIYERPFEVLYREADKLPADKPFSQACGGHLEGCRIGFDAGGSDRKVSAVVDGETVFSEEVVWHPKTNSDPQYHYEGIVSAFKTAASKMPRVDAIGVSSAGVYVDNRIMAASLFLKVNEDDFNKYVKDMYIRAAAEIGDVPLEVANDGDVTALAGAMELGDTNVLGIAMGTSQAGGYINAQGGLNGWLNELAFVPCDFSSKAMRDEWAGDIGCGVKYFSQDGVIKLAGMAGIPLDEAVSPAEKLKAVQALNDVGDKRAARVFHDIGVYLGHSLPYYAMFYDIKYVLLLGRVLSGKGGDQILDVCKAVLKRCYPDFNAKVIVPDESSRRVGQSIAAASLPMRE